MNLLAKNQITVTKSLFLEANLRISREGYGRSARRSMLIFLGLWAAFLVYTIWIQGNLLQTVGLLGLIGLIWLWLCVYLPRSHAKKAWKAQQAHYGAAIARTTEFYDDHLWVSGEGVDTTIAYADVLEIQQSRRLLILICREQVGVILDLNGFSIGSADTVKALINHANKGE